MRPVHLARRFFGSLRPGGPAPADEAWAEAQLLPGEQGVWRRMPTADRRHAAGVARTVARELGGDATRPVLAAALLHDSGKVVSGLGTFARVLATLVGLVRGREAPGGGSAPTCATPSTVPSCWPRRAATRSPSPGPASTTCRLIGGRSSPASPPPSAPPTTTDSFRAGAQIGSGGAMTAIVRWVAPGPKDANNGR